MLATRTANPAALPCGPERALEVRGDGVRPLADTGGDQLRLLGRTGRDVAAACPAVAGSAHIQGAVLDGEEVAREPT